MLLASHFFRLLIVCTIDRLKPGLYWLASRERQCSGGYGAGGRERKSARQQNLPYIRAYEPACLLSSPHFPLREVPKGGWKLLSIVCRSKSPKVAPQFRPPQAKYIVTHFHLRYGAQYYFEVWRRFCSRSEGQTPSGCRVGDVTILRALQP